MSKLRDLSSSTAPQFTLAVNLSWDGESAGCQSMFRSGSITNYRFTENTGNVVGRLAPASSGSPFANVVIRNDLSGAHAAVPSFAFR